jgi:hypothetical protein
MLWLSAAAKGGLMTTKKFQVWMHDPSLGGNWENDENYYSLNGPEPSPAELAAADAAYEDAFDNGAISLETDKSSIVGNGLDAATITVTFRLPYPDYVILSVAGLEMPVLFSPKGAGGPYTRTAQITNLKSIYPGETIIIEPVRWGSADVPGGDSLTIEVE